MNNSLYYPLRPPKVKICKAAIDGRHVFIPPAVNCEACGTGGIIVNGEVLYVPTEKGIEYHQRQEINVLFYGGRGSAKSTTGRWDAHMRALAYPGFSYCILRRTYPELNESHLKFIPREIELLGGTYNQTDHIVKYPNGSRGRFAHCATDADVLKLLSAEFALMVFDEISTFEWDQFIKLAASVRVPVGADYIATVRGLTNPFGPSAQKLLEYFVDKTVDREEDPDYNPDDWYAIKANLVDNPYLDQAQYSKRFSGLPPHIRKAWVEGEFALENALFDFHPTQKGKPYHVTPDIDLPKILQNATIYRAIDAGWSPDPTVCLWIANLGNRHIIFNEMTWYKRTAAEIAQEILQEDKRLGIKRVAVTYCDPSMNINTTADIRTIMEIYEANGISMEPSINNREMFAYAMHNALAEEAYEGVPRLQILHNGMTGCPMLTRTIPQMRFDPKQPKRMDDHKNDHWVIAACYYLMSHASDLKIEGSNGLGVIKPWMKEKKQERYVLGNDQVRES